MGIGIGGLEGAGRDLVVARLGAGIARHVSRAIGYATGLERDPGRRRVIAAMDEAGVNQTAARRVQFGHETVVIVGRRLIIPGPEAPTVGIWEIGRIGQTGNVSVAAAIHRDAVGLVAVGAWLARRRVAALTTEVG